MFDNNEQNDDCLDQVEANGENEHPLFTLLKKSLPTPSDDAVITFLNSSFSTKTKAKTERFHL